MARMCVDLGRVNSKYDCVLGANLNPDVPVDRHVFVKRLRVWVNADGFLSPLDFKNLASFRPVRPPSGILWPTRATAARWKSNCAPKCSTEQKHDRLSIQPPDRKTRARQTIARRRRRAPDRALATLKTGIFTPKPSATAARIFISPRTRARLTKKPALLSRPRRPPIARVCRRGRISSAAGMVRKHSASGRANARPGRQRRRLQPRLV